MLLLWEDDKETQTGQLLRKFLCHRTTKYFLNRCLACLTKRQEKQTDIRGACTKREINMLIEKNTAEQSSKHVIIKTARKCNVDTGKNYDIHCQRKILFYD